MDIHFPQSKSRNCSRNRQGGMPGIDDKSVISVRAREMEPGRSIPGFEKKDTFPVTGVATIHG